MLRIINICPETLRWFAQKVCTEEARGLILINRHLNTSSPWSWKSYGSDSQAEYNARGDWPEASLLRNKAKVSHSDSITLKSPLAVNYGVGGMVVRNMEQIVLGEIWMLPTIWVGWASKAASRGFYIHEIYCICQPSRRVRSILCFVHH